MMKLHYNTTIQAPASKVYDIMLGITNKATYEAWTAAFNPTSSYEGSWDKDSKIHFLGVDEKGEKGGMVSRIAENIPHQFVSIQHYGLLKGDQEITTGPDVEKWANGTENYTFKESNESTTLLVELEISDDFESYMNETYPLALVKLKELCEE